MHIVFLYILLSAFSLVCPQNSNFTEEYQTCIKTYCQYDTNCNQQAKPFLLQALNKYSLQSIPTFEDLFLWYSEFYRQLSVYSTNKSLIAQDASIFCFVSYNWYLDKINTKSIQPIPPQPYYQFVQTDKLQKNTVPMTQFSYLFFDCILNQCLYNDSCFNDLVNKFLSILKKSQNSNTIQEWYNSFQDISNQIAILNCFMAYDWKQDFVNKNQSGNGPITPPKSSVGILKNVQFYILIVLSMF
ncbi:hypothetical protein ABPG74_002543 [Tetrahymena malaccensis]